MLYIVIFSFCLLYAFAMIAIKIPNIDNFLNVQAPSLFMS